jgi:hypothetical protein
MNSVDEGIKRRVQNISQKVTFFTLHPAPHCQREIIIRHMMGL